MLCYQSSAPAPARRGAAAIEMAILAPFLVLLMVIAVDWARIFYYTVTINDCARNGAVYLASTNDLASSPYTSYTQAALAGTNLSPTPTVSSASGSDATGPWVEVTVSYPFTTISNFPGVPHSTTVTRTVRMIQTAKVPN
jgi:Flp pilus assembly protein TadG